MFIKEEGVTLTILAITIIVLLILVGISLVFVFGKNGVLTQASDSVLINIEAKAKEEIEMLWQSATAEYLRETTQDSTKEKSEFYTADYLNQYISGGEGTGKVLETIHNIDGTYTVKYQTAYPETTYTYIIDENTAAIKRRVETRDGITVGDYITYVAPTKDNYELSTTVSGYSKDQTISQEYTIWRVLNIYDDGSMDLVADVTLANDIVYFTGALGYNNGVFALNNICEYLYTDDSRGIKARSINIEDIESHFSTEGKNRKSNYINNFIKNLVINEEYVEKKDITTNTVTYKTEKSFYPIIYQYQLKSESNPYYTTPTTDTYEQADNLAVEQTYYLNSMKPSYFDDCNENSSNFYKIIFGTNTFYWIASRFCACQRLEANFGIRIVDENSISGAAIFFSGDRAGTSPNAICPIISISSDRIVEKCKGINSSENTHRITKY